MNADPMIRHALLAGMPGTGKTVAASLMSRTEWTPPAARDGDDSGARHPVTATEGTAGCANREVKG